MIAPLHRGHGYLLLSYLAFGGLTLRITAGLVPAEPFSLPSGVLLTVR